MSQEKVKLRRFEVDAEGFAQQEKARNPVRLVQELISNAFDEDTCEEVNVTLEWLPRKKAIGVRVVDDGTGFERVEDVYTLFGYSKKVLDPSKRGRFNLGEKQFFAACVYGYIETSGKMIEMVRGKDERLESKSPRDTGTEIYGELDFGESHIEKMIARLKKIIVPLNKKFFLNGKEIKPRETIKTFKSKLKSVKANNPLDRVLRDIVRETDIEILPKQFGMDSWIYELGVPVQSIDCKWDINVQQKIPLSHDRDKVRDTWLKDLYGIILNNTHELVDKEDSGAMWVAQGLTTATAEAAKDIVFKKFDTDKVFFQSTDYQANEAATESGGLLIKDRSFDGETKRHLAEIGVIEYTSDVPDFKASLFKSRTIEPTQAMRDFGDVIPLVARDTIGHFVTVEFCAMTTLARIADYENATQRMRFNVTALPKNWFDKFTPENIGVIIHELSHDKKHEDGESHLTNDYVREIERIAGIIAFHGISHWVSMRILTVGKEIV